MKSKALSFLSIVFLLAGCASPLAYGTAEAGLVFQDGLNRTVTLAGPAQKIISLAPSNTEIIFGLGAGSQLIGRDDFSNFPDAALSLPSIGDTMGSISLEKITALQPDLILASPLTTADQVKSMEGLGLTVFLLPNPKSFEDLYRNLEVVGSLTGREKEAATLAESLKTRVEQVENQLLSQSEKPLIFYELDATEPAKPWTSGPGTFVDYLINLAGGTNLGGSLSGEWVQISQEELIVKDPDVILLGDSTYGGITADQVASRPGWSEIKAVKNQKVFSINDDLISRPGPRMVDGLEELAKIIHPEVFNAQ